MQEAIERVICHIEDDIEASKRQMQEMISEKDKAYYEGWINAGLVYKGMLEDELEDL